MKVFIISDEEFKTEIYKKISELLKTFFGRKGFDIEEVSIGREDLAFCMGCFGCWVKKPGECVIGDLISELNRKQMNSDVVLFLTPLVFGQFSANIKNVLDRWLPNALPFFFKRADGSTMHPPRYSSYPKQLMIGYGESLSDRDSQLFIDINKKHRFELDVLIWRDNSEDFTEGLAKVDYKRVVNGV